MRLLAVLTDDDVAAAYDNEGSKHVSTFMNMKALQSRYKKAIKYVRKNIKAYNKQRVWNKDEPDWRTLAKGLLDPTSLKRLILEASQQEQQSQPRTKAVQHE
eukprot:GHVU01137900.1.p1 GENE.GHVU01137900.1~~GHVU01137900.1.p1  ORF type:complete len:102 (-),score=19.12 GHVU01137900.1:335-640(-)